MSTPPVGWGSTYCFTDVSVGVIVSITPITKGTPAQIFFLGGLFLFPRALAFGFCYDLDLCSQGQVVRAFFLGMGFSLILSKSTMGILINRARKLHRQVAHDLIVDPPLTYFCAVLCSAKTSY